MSPMLSQLSLEVSWGRGLEMRVWEVEASRICREMPGERGEEEGREGVGGRGLCMLTRAHTHTHVRAHTLCGGSAVPVYCTGGSSLGSDPSSGQRRAWFAGITG